MLAKTPVQDQASLDLTRAADFLEKTHLVKGSLCDAYGGSCTYNAIARGMGLNPLDINYAHPPPRFGAAEQRFLAYVGTDYICEWNNAPERTKEQVVAALRGAAQAVVSE